LFWVHVETTGEKFGVGGSGAAPNPTEKKH